MRPGADAGLLAGFRLGLGGAAAQCGADHHHGFILSCTLCYLLAVQGLRRAGGQAGVNAPRTWVTDFVVGLLISAPVFWMFTKFLAINLPGLTSNGVDLTWKSSMP